MMKYFEGKIHYEITISVSVTGRRWSEDYTRKEIITIKDGLYRCDNFEDGFYSTSIKTQANYYFIDLENKYVIENIEGMTIDENMFRILNTNQEENLLNFLCREIKIEEINPKEEPYSQKLFIAKNLPLNPILKNKRFSFLSGFIPLKIEHCSKYGHYTYQTHCIATKIEQSKILPETFKLKTFSSESFKFMTSKEYEALLKKEEKERETFRIQEEKEKKRKKESERPIKNAKDNELYKPLISIFKKHGIQTTPEMKKEPRLAVDLFLQLKGEIKDKVTQDFLDTL